MCAYISLNLSVRIIFQNPVLLPVSNSYFHPFSVAVLATCKYTPGLAYKSDNFVDSAVRKCTDLILDSR